MSPRRFLGIPQPVDPNHSRRGRVVVTVTQALEVVEPAHLALRLRARALPPLPYAVVGVYRCRNAEVVSRMLRSAGPGVPVAWWALDEVAQSLAYVTVGVGRGLRPELINRLVDHLDLPPETAVVVSDDDWAFVRGGLPDLVRGAVAARLDFAQPSHAMGSHINWNITRHRLGTLARRGRFVEQGPVFVLNGHGRERILPLPTDIGMGWGMEALWWAKDDVRMGILDGVTIRHLTPVGDGGYDTAEQWNQAQRMLEATGHQHWSGVQPDLGRWYWWQRHSPWDSARRTGS